MRFSKNYLLALLSSGLIITNPVFADESNNTTKLETKTQENKVQEIKESKESESKPEVKNDTDNKETKVANESNVLTLFQAIDIALQNNYSLKLSEEKIKAATYQVTQSAAQGLPQLTINTSYGRQDPVAAPPPTAGNSLANSPQFASLLGTSRTNSFQNQVSLTQVLFAGFRVVDGIKLATVSVDLSKESSRQTRQDVVSNISTSYYNSLKALQLININNAALKQSQLHVEQAKKLEAAGVGIKLDVVRASNQLVNTQLQLSQALNSYEKSKKVLNLAMGRSIDYPFELNPEVRVPEIKLDEEKMLQQGLQNRSELKQLGLKKKFDELSTTIQSRGNWPLVSANLSYNISNTSIANTNDTNQQNLKYGLNMNWPIFDGLLTYAKVQTSQNNVIQDQISIDQTQQSVILDMKQAILDIKEAKERVLMSKNGIFLAKDALKIAEIRYNNGVGISLDVIDAQNLVIQAESNLINANFDLNIGKVKLYRAMGIDI